jgi:hypothetical protein
MNLKQIRQKLTEAADGNPAEMRAQEKGLKPAKPKDDYSQKVRAAATALGLKGINVPAVTNAHKQLQTHGNIARLPQNLRNKYLDFSGEVPSHLMDAPLNQFRNTLQKLKQIKNLTKQLNNSFEITDKEQISEAARLKDELNPPYMLVLKRRGIRIFPDGKRVALYVNEKLGLTFTIPYVPSGSSAKEILPGVQAEEIEISEELIDENLEHLNDIVDKHQAKELKFLDGSKLKVDAQTAKAITLVHNALNDENKAKVARMLSHSKNQFMKVADFAHKNTAYKIDK